MLRNLDLTVDIILAVKDTIKSETFKRARSNYRAQMKAWKQEYKNVCSQIKGDLDNAIKRELEHNLNARRFKRVGPSLAVKDGLVVSVFD